MSDPEWASLSDEELLGVRMCDLHLTIEGTELEQRIAQVNAEIEARSLPFHPHYWLSDEWFTPDGVPGIAIPFYLAHPRLARLELAQMLEIEGGDPDACLRILRHEVGHAIDNAYQLRRRPTRRRLFGSPIVEYPEYYTPKPYSKSFVHHLDHWYTSRRQVDPLSRLKKTLGEHYRKKREHYGLDHPDFYDSDLRNLFSDAPEYAKNPSAARFIRSIRKEVRGTVASFTDSYQYTIEQLIEKVIARCRELNLRLTESPEATKTDFMVFLTVQTMNYLHSGRHRVAL
jgi:hypothetical protein